MRRGLLTILVLVLGILVYSAVDVLLAQEEDAEEVEYSWGTVSSISSNQIIVNEYDYGEDEDVEISYSLDPKLELKGVESLEDIEAGDSIEIDYVVKAGKKIAQIIAIEKTYEYEVEEEEEYIPSPIYEEEKEEEYAPEEQEYAPIEIE